MSVPSPASSFTYVGNGSTQTPYPFPAPFLDPAHIFAAKSADGVATPVLLSASEYSVTRFADGSGGSVRTTAPVTSPATLVIFRRVPLTQPMEIQPAGPFPAESVETGFDRVVMMIQQLKQQMDDLHGISGGGGHISVPSGGAAYRDTVAWETPGDRGGATASRIGQLGVEISTQTLWISQSTFPGAWSIYRSGQPGKLVLGVVADAGSPGSNQTAAAAMLTAWSPDAVLFCGDNNYNGAAGYAADWAAFSTWITAEKAFPALGNHDIDEAGWQSRHAGKFPYLPGNGRYYSKTLGGGLLEVFCLHSGINTAGATIEPDGNETGSVQHAWFVAAVAASRARWKIAVFHHPPVTSAVGSDRVAAQMRWPELAKMDAIFCGHTHTLELIKWGDTALWNLSAMKDKDGSPQAVAQGAGASDAILWADFERFGMGRIVVTHEKLTVEAWAIDAGAPSADGQRKALLHSRECRDLSPMPTEMLAAQAIDAADTISTATWHVTTLAAALQVTRVTVAAADAGAGAISWILSAGVVVLASGSIAGATRTQSVGCDVPDSVIPRGTTIAVAITHSGTRKGFNVILETKRFS